MAHVIDFYAARERLRPEPLVMRTHANTNTKEDAHAFVIVELPKEVADTLHNSDHPDWMLVLDYIIYGNTRPH